MTARLAAWACPLGGLYFLLYSRGHTLWILDLLFFVLALLLWLARERVGVLPALSVAAAIGVRHLGPAPVVAALDLLLAGAVLRWGAQVEAWPGWKGAKASLLPGWGALALLVVLAAFVGRPVVYMVAPKRRNARLLSFSPAFPIQDPKTLSPLGARLRAHVHALAEGIGERSLFQPAAQRKARDYVVKELAAMGYAPRLLEYELARAVDLPESAAQANVEAVLEGTDPSAAAWVVGAHYDSAPGTPGADDNASGVAVLLETARLLRAAKPARTVRFVAFGTEEPPCFGSRDMGSWHYAHGLRRDGVRPRGLLNLEMLGYFNPKPGAQLHPPFMQLLFPDRGDFVALAANLSSAGLGFSFRRAWREVSPFPLETVVLPSVFSVVALSDQLNFWFGGLPAVMLSDTSFFRTPHYHQSTDTPEKLDYERMAAVTEAAAKVLTR